MTLEEGHDFQLDYYIVEEEVRNSYCVYGIEVKKRNNTSQVDILKESECIHPLTEDKALATDMVDKLIQLSVTPIGLVESVDTLYSILEQ